MLKKLKIKFIAVIMTIVTILFAAIFVCVTYLTKSNIERDSIQMMRSFAFHPMPPVHADLPVDMPDDKPDNRRLPFFTIRFEADGELETFGDSYYDLTDKALLNDLVNAVFQKNEQIGVISEYDLRYCVVYSNDVTEMVFADISNEKAMMRILVRNSIIIGLIGYAVFFIISFLLAEWVSKPIEKTWNEQKQFIADASHELKTPLTVIMTNAEMLTDSGYNEDDKSHFTKNILAMSKRMRGLVESLLELAKMDNGTAVSTYKTVDYSKLISDSVLPFEPLFYEKDMEIISDIENDIQVNGDKEKLGQVVNILLDNAMKYSDEKSSVKITLKHQKTHCILSVSNKGKTISKSDCKKIFKRFYRVDKARNDGQSYGLGLSIADRIISEHNGHIWAESENGYNTFYVSLVIAAK